MLLPQKNHFPGTNREEGSSLKCTAFEASKGRQSLQSNSVSSAFTPMHLSFSFFISFRSFLHARSLSSVWPQLLFFIGVSDYRYARETKESFERGKDKSREWLRGRNDELEEGGAGRGRRKATGRHGWQGV